MRARAGLRNGLLRLFMTDGREAVAVLAGFMLFFLLFSSYFMLRPVRETMGIAGGVRNLQWLFSATFVLTLVTVPLYGWVSARVRRQRLLPWSYGFVALTLVAFAAAMHLAGDDVWLARAFYVWLSVFNLFVISIAWSFVADMLDADQAHRLFAQIAAGASLGGLAGPLIGGVLVGVVGHPGLLLLSAALLLCTLLAVRRLLQWRDALGARPAVDDPARAIGGAVWAGLTLVLRSRHLLGIAAFVILVASVTTFLYMEQARIVADAFPDPVRQTQVFSALDALVQALTILLQVFVTGRLAQRLGVRVLLTAVPLAMMAGFLVLAAAATFPVLAVVMVVRRVGEYALVRPGREMLFAALDTETKYKAKNVIDTVVYRGGDAISAWLKTLVDALGAGAALAAVVGAALAALWGLLGFRLGSAHDSRNRPAP